MVKKHVSESRGLGFAGKYHTPYVDKGAALEFFDNYSSIQSIRLKIWQNQLEAGRKIWRDVNQKRGPPIHPPPKSIFQL